MKRLPAKLLLCVVVAVVGAAGCGGSGEGSEPTAPDGDGEAPEAAAPPPEVPELMSLDGAPPKPGEEFLVLFDETNSRGGAFWLSPWTGDEWADPVYLLGSDANGGSPTALRLTDESFGWDDWGTEGPGPDGFLLPADIEDGHWRLCTANAADEACLQLAVGVD